MLLEKSLESPLDNKEITLRGLQETRVATREESGVLGFPSRRGLTPRGSLECNPVCVETQLGAIS